MATYRLTLLGYPSLQRDGARTPLALRKALALLAYLERQRRPIARDALVAVLWPDADEEGGRAALRRLLHRLRPHVPGLLETEGDAVGIAEGTELSSDAADIERAAAALAAQPGDRSTASAEMALEAAGAPFLEGFALRGCEAFEDWQRVEAERLQALCGRLFATLHRAETGAGRHDRATELARRWVAQEPLEEAAHRALIGSLLAAGRSADAGHQGERMRTLLARELGVAPSAETQALLASMDAAKTPASASTSGVARPETRPETRYVSSGGVHIAYQVTGSGQRHLVLLPGFVTHLEAMWENPQIAAFLEALGRMGRVIAFDRRGIGLSDRIGLAPSAEATLQDMTAVLDAAGAERAIPFGTSEGGPAAVLFAARKPERTRGLILYGTLAKGSAAPDYACALTAAQYKAWLSQIRSGWGGPVGLDVFAPTAAGDAATRAWWSRLLRLAATPGSMAAIVAALRDSDVRAELARVKAPALVLHRRHDRAVRIEAGRHIAAGLSHARFVELAGHDHWPWTGDADSVLREVAAFVRSV
jgi:DNA-binding SARP family transcriptional activator/pimeloyl-ACP methyl ester carboxylesterase